MIDPEPRSWALAQILLQNAFIMLAEYRRRARVVVAEGAVKVLDRVLRKARAIETKPDADARTTCSRWTR